MKYAIQLHQFWTRCLTKRQTLRTIKRTAEMGWDGIELFQCTNISPDLIREAAGRCEILNPMIWYKNFEPDRIGRTCDWLKALGAPTAAYTSLPVLHPDEEVYRKYNPGYIRIARTLAENGLTFCHHNHTEEYVLTDGRTGIDVLLRDVEPYCLEIDTYWAQEAGRDVVALMEERRDHLRYIHLKDRKPGAKKFCALGEGAVNNRLFVGKAAELGLEYVILDLDNSDCDTFEAAEKSLKWLRDNFG